MKNFVTLLLALIGCTPLLAQGPASRLPDPDNIDPGAGWFYYENRGQIIDKAQNIRSDIKYYTTHQGVKMYLGEDTISFAGSTRSVDTLVRDSSSRLDMQFYCANRDQGSTCPSTIATYEQSTDVLNYYLPHCGDGIEDVPGYAGVVYQNAFQSTDVHFFSAASGPVTYFVFHPDADTSAFALQFRGQDSIAAIANYLHLYIGQHGMTFANGIAYQVDQMNNIIPLSWMPVWYISAPGIVKLKLGTYNPAYDLIIRSGEPGKIAAGTGTDNLVWTTYYGGKKRDSSPDSLSRWASDGLPVIKSNSTGTLVYHAMTSNSDDFNVTAGNAATTAVAMPYNNDFDCVLSCFDAVNGVRQWATFYGGSGHEEANAIELIPQSSGSSNPLGNLVLAGRTKSTDLPLYLSTSVPWRKRTNLPPSAFSGFNCSSFLASFGASNGSLKYATYFGGSEYCFLNDLTYDETKDEIVFCGYMATSVAWNTIVDTVNAFVGVDTLSLRRAPGRYYQNSDPQGETGFIGAFNAYTRDLVWCTLVGGTGKDYFNEIVTDKSVGLYALGNTTSPIPNNSPVFTTSPITSPWPSALPLVIGTGGSTYWQYNIQGQHALVLHFNAARAVDWCTLFGGVGNEEFTGIAVNSKKDLYIAGTSSYSDTIHSNMANNVYPVLPNYATGTSYIQGPGSYSTITGANQGQDAVIARFDSSHQLTWCTFWGKKGSEFNPTRLAIDNADHIFMSGNNAIDLNGNTQGIPIYRVNGRYQQDSNNSTPSFMPGAANTAAEAADGYIVQFNSSNQPVWSTHYGGRYPGTHIVNSGSIADAREEITSIDLGVNNGKVSLFMTGISKNPRTPMLFSNGAQRCPSPSSAGIRYCDTAHDGDWDAFIGKFDDARSTAVEPISYSRSGTLMAAPNPSHDRFSINFISLNSGSGKVPVTVSNATGQVLLRAQANILQGENQFILDLKDLPSGIYFLHVVAGGQNEAIRLIKY